MTAIGSMQEPTIPRTKHIAVVYPRTVRIVQGARRASRSAPIVAGGMATGRTTVAMVTRRTGSTRVTAGPSRAGGSAKWRIYDGNSIERTVDRLRRERCVVVVRQSGRRDVR